MGDWIWAQLQVIEELLCEQRDRLLQGLSCWRTVMDSENNPVQIHLLQSVVVSQPRGELYFLNPPIFHQVETLPTQCYSGILVVFTHGSLVDNLEITWFWANKNRELTKSESNPSSAPPGNTPLQVKNIHCLLIFYDLFMDSVYSGGIELMCIHFSFVTLCRVCRRLSSSVLTWLMHRINTCAERSLGMLGLNVGDDVQSRKTISFTSCADACNPFPLQRIVTLDVTFLWKWPCSWNPHFPSIHGDQSQSQSVNYFWCYSPSDDNPRNYFSHQSSEQLSKSYEHISAAPIQYAPKYCE